MPQGNGLGFISQDIQDLFRPLNGKLALKDPPQLKPVHRVRKCAKEVPEELIPIPQQFWSLDNKNLVLAKDLPSWCPAGVLTIKLRLADEAIPVADVVRGPYMKWAIAESLAEAILTVSGVQICPREQLLFCMDEVKLIDVQMPYNGKQVWQFCDFRFDYMLDINGQDANMAVQAVWHEMAVFERVFCKALEWKYRDIYHLTVLNLLNKQNALLDGEQLSWGRDLFEAACRNDVDAIRRLVETSAAADVNWRPKEAAYPTSLLEEEFRMLWVGLGRPALLGAAEEGHVEAMRILLDAKADVNFQDNSGFHALYLGAGAENAEEVVKFLIAKGGRVNLKNKSGYTPLHNACGCGEAGAIKALLDARADLNSRSSTGSAPVHVAVLNNQADALEALAKLGANLDIPAFGGNTPVHEAVMQNSPAMIQKLVELKANMNIESGPEHQFSTPLRMARDRKKKKAARALETLGALEKIEGGHEREDGSRD
jgi:hypothetical protein